MQAVFYLDVALFVTLGGCITRLTWIRANTEDVTSTDGATEGEAVGLAIVCLVVTAFFVAREVAQMRLYRKIELRTRKLLDQFEGLESAYRVAVLGTGVVVLSPFLAVAGCLTCFKGML